MHYITCIRSTWQLVPIFIYLWQSSAYFRGNVYKKKFLNLNLTFLRIIFFIILEKYITHKEYANVFLRHQKSFQIVLMF